MTIVSTFTVSGLQFPLTRALSNAEGGRVEVDRFVRRGEHVEPVFWVTDADEETYDGVEAALRAEDSVTELSVLDDVSDHRLYRVSWEHDEGGLLWALSNSDGAVLTARGTADAAEFVVRFPDVQSFQVFLETCEDHNIPVEDVGRYEPEDIDAEPVSMEDVELLLAAVDSEYFGERPSLSGLADEYGVTPDELESRLTDARDRLSRALFD